MDNCVFCKIVKGDIPCSKIYENDNFLVFLDIAPINFGHCLVIPKEHYENLLYVPDEVLGEYFSTVKKISSAIKSSLNCDGFNIGLNNYPAAGQVVMHSHTHVVPRYTDDNLEHWPSKKYENNSFIEDLRNKIINSL